jgi:hypothetical protein
MSSEIASTALIGCECSGIVRDAMRTRGINAWSCDLKPCEKEGGYHMQRDVVDAIKSRDRWRLIGLHPDCTYMSVSGNRWYGRGMPKHHMRIEAVEWTLAVWQLACSRADFTYLENPNSVIFPELRKRGVRVQHVQPWQFGHGETKQTGFALHNLPELLPTNEVNGRENRVWKMPPGPSRKTDRSRTYTGIGEAIADQWGMFILDGQE